MVKGCARASRPCPLFSAICSLFNITATVTVVDGTNAVGSFVVHSSFLERWSMSHFKKQERGVVESAGFYIGEIWLEQHFHATGTFDANNDDIHVWELTSLLPVNSRIRFELSVVNKTCVAQFFFDILSNRLLCSGIQYPCSVSFFIKYSPGSDTDDTILAYRHLQISTSQSMKKRTFLRVC